MRLYASRFSIPHQTQLAHLNAYTIPMSAFEKNAPKNAIHAAFRQAEQLELAGHYPQALAIYQQLNKQQPRWPFAYFGIGSVYSAIGRFEDARKNLRKAISLSPDNPNFHAKLALVLNKLDDKENALIAADTALKFEPTNTDFILNKAIILRYNGDPAAAFALLKKSIEDGNTAEVLIRVYAVLCGVLDRPQDGLDALVPLTKTVNPNPMITATHFFVLTKLYDQTKQYDLAFAAAQQGAALRVDTYNPNERTKLFQDRTRAWSKERFATLPRSRVNSDKPVFIVGMPRSGTTLIEQIIASHPSAYGAGELIGIPSAAAEITSPTELVPDLIDVVSQRKQATLDRVARRILKDMESQAPKGEKPARITDKLPLNFQHIGLIEQLFPNASIIHCTRHVLDTFISCYLLDFAGINNHAYTYDPNHFAHFYKLYLSYMDHWKQVSSLPILEISYEDTVADQRAMTHRLLEFVDLEWDDQCMNFFETQRSVNTASVEQVRKPIYTSSKARWKNFESHLDPIKEALERNGVPIQ